MKLSKVPTGYIIIKADNNSDTEVSNFAIIYVLERLKSTLIAAQKAIECLGGDWIDNSDVNSRYTLDEIKFYCSTVEFFNLPDEKIEEIIGKNLDSFSYSYLETTGNEIHNKLGDYEVSVDCLKLCVDENHFNFKGYGAGDSTDEYWTDSVRINDLISAPSPKKIKKAIEKSLVKIKNL